MTKTHKTQWKRYLASATAITLTTLFITTTLAMANALDKTIYDLVTDSTRGVAVTISYTKDTDSHGSLNQKRAAWPAVIRAVKNIPSVDTVTALDLAPIYVWKDGHEHQFLLTPLPPARAFSDRVIAGHIPAAVSIKATQAELPGSALTHSSTETNTVLNTVNANETSTNPLPVVIGSGAAKKLKLKVGDTFAATRGTRATPAQPATASHSNSTSDSAVTPPMRVAAIVQGLPIGADRIYANAETREKLGFPVASLYGLALYSNANPEALQTAVRAALTSLASNSNSQDDSDGLTATELVVQTNTVAIANDQALSPNRRITQYAFLLIFPLFALLIGSTLVSATFKITLTARTRELALLRCIGATKKQIRHSVMAEAATLGIISSAIGVVIGTGLGIAAAIGLDMADNAMIAFAVIGWSPLVAGLSIGIAMTLIAAWRPARAATRVSPIVGLATSPNTAGPTRKVSALRMASGITLLVAGTAALVIGLIWQNRTGYTGVPATVIAGCGAIVLLLAIIILLGSLLSYLARFALRPFRQNATIAAAADNLTRDSRRTAATGTTVAVGITVVTALMFSASTVTSSVNSYLLQTYPVDMVVGTRDGALPQQLITDLRSSPQVTDSKIAISTRAHIELSDTGAFTGGEAQSPQANTPVKTAYTGTIVSLPQIQSLSHGKLRELKPGEVYAPLGDTKHPNRYARITIGKQTREFHVIDNKDIGVFALSGSDFVEMTAGLPDMLIQPGAIFLKTKVDIAGEQLNQLSRTVRTSPDAFRLQVAGSAPARGEVLTGVAKLLQLVIGLLAVTIVIALLGIANTLSLAVAQRQRESALLRAIGMTKRQLRRSIVVEALAISLVSTCVGIATGTGVTWLFLQALPVGADFAWSFVLPLGQLGGLIVITIVAALLAAWIPSRMATKVSPVEALARADY